MAYVPQKDFNSLKIKLLSLVPGWKTKHYLAMSRSKCDIKTKSDCILYLKSNHKQSKEFLDVEVDNHLC